MKLLDIETPAGDFIYELADKTQMLARVRRLPSKAGYLGIAVKVCELTSGGVPYEVDGEIVWTRKHTASMNLAGMLTEESLSIKEQIQEIVENIATGLVKEIEAVKLTMEAVAEIPMEGDT